MQYRKFGATGMEVSELVFGAGAVGGLLIDADDQTKLNAIRRALDAGINFIDTAPSYGATKSEQALGPPHTCFMSRELGRTSRRIPGLRLQQT